jgi:hypothetical protein
MLKRKNIAQIGKKTNSQCSPFKFAITCSMELIFERRHLNKHSMLLSIFWLLLACHHQKRINDLGNEIIGTWCLVSNQINYPRIKFNADKLATFDSRIDTVYFFAYSINKASLKLVERDSTISENRILLLTKDSLIFETLREHKSLQVYYRCKED